MSENDSLHALFVFSDVCVSRHCAAAGFILRSRVLGLRPNKCGALWALLAKMLSRNIVIPIILKKCRKIEEYGDIVRYEQLIFMITI